MGKNRRLSSIYMVKDSNVDKCAKPDGNVLTELLILIIILN